MSEPSNMHVYLEKSKERALALSLARRGEVSSRRFVLERTVDVHGVSGTGTVADGVMFPDGRCAVRWRSTYSSTACWDDIAELEHVHSHGGDGHTHVVWIDQ
jgi:hypothetical protein